MKYSTLVYTFLLTLSLPVTALAVDKNDNFATLVDEIISLLQVVIPFIFSVALLVIIWKIIDTWIINAGDTTKLAAGRQFVLYAVLILVVMSGIWGILALLRSSLF